MNLLLVEDNEDLNTLLTEMLRMQGHTVTPAFSAEAVGAGANLPLSRRFQNAGALDDCSSSRA